MSRRFIKAGLVCLWGLAAVLMYAQNAKPALKILDHYLDINTDCVGDTGFTVHFTKYQISNLKNHYVLMSFILKQNGQWLPATRLYAGGEEIKVLHDEAVFTWSPPDTLWFCYPYVQIETAGGDISQPFEGYLIVTEQKGKERKDTALAKLDLSIDFNALVLEGRGADVSMDLAVIEIEYATALGDRIEIRNKVLYFEAQTGFEGDMQGPSANFAPVRTARQKQLSDADLQDLVDVFYANNFRELEEGYGTSPGNRYYPETLRFKDGWGDKTVVYRSGQDEAAGSKPPEFDVLVEAILALKNKYFPNE